MGRPIQHVLLMGIFVAATVSATHAADVEWINVEPQITRLTRDGGSFTRRGLGYSPTEPYIAHYRGEQAGFTYEGAQPMELVVVSEDGQKEHVVSRLGQPWTATWSPDGRHLAYVFSESRRPESDTRVYVWSLDSGESREVGRGFTRSQFGSGTGYHLPVWSPDSRYFVC